MTPAGNCYGSITKYIILNATPNPTVSNVTTQAPCTNAVGSATINVASGTAPFTYNWLPAASTESLVSGLMPGTDYTVNVIDTFGCRHSTIVSIASFTDAPTYTITPLNGILTCNTNSILVVANTASNTIALWTHTNTASFVATSVGNYSCIVTNTISNCIAIVPVSITNNTATPSATITPLTCSGNNVTLNATSGSGVSLGWLAPTQPNATYIGNPGSSSTAGIYTLSAINLSNGCKTTYTADVVFPTVTVATSPNSPILTCTTKTLQLTASYTPTNAIINWINASGTNTLNPYSVSSIGSYTAVVTVPSGCSAKASITITSNTLSSVNITSTSTIIPCSTGNLALTANGNSTSYTYTWQPSNPFVNAATYSVSNEGTYTVIATNSVNGCTATAVKSVSHETVTASFITDSLSGYMPLSVSFTNTSINPSSTIYTWNLGNSPIIFTGNYASTVYSPQGVYQVTLTATNGFCQDTALQLIYVKTVSFLIVPNVFTPNGDGKNDVFTFDAINIDDIAFSVFDRWGLKVAEMNVKGNVSWDGKNKSGALVADGTYFYTLKAKGLDDKKYEMKGTINIFQ
jgi:gliding motility-associated-like protein